MRGKAGPEMFPAFFVSVETNFLKYCFWYLPSECNISNKNQQYGVNYEWNFLLDCPCT
jgi:hypothetical protein